MVMSKVRYIHFMLASNNVMIHIALIMLNLCINYEYSEAKLYSQGYYITNILKGQNI